MNKLEKAFTLFDAYNKKDPNIFIWKGKTYPQEYFLALRLYEWVLKLEPNASEELLLASRSQHIGRWEMPRDSYPEGREAYLRWRRELAFFHAEKSTELMVEAGFGTETTSRVRQIILKQKIKVDHEVQTIENALCLVFLQFQYEDFYPKHSPEKVINILRKSLLKMDWKGHQHALSLKFSAEGQNYINEALKLI
ncbi:uncharacterized protein DUF4202 [Arcticibacter tournemirensis]|uniref:DUF4202 family protein n=1 Tax=Arcticibacter tournemirensis TaxID=699437 RepID=A0A5M9HFE6_9SPHI|nr:DUF4202 domain-containing protein [Arcticibacter tournemirensis]KAA8484114.1 DUF4202 family protein [Arcticibacter tournemirensis]TQM51854.1 uncharacterized protein DUF4202 [Arcticibacter tournemirensis]